MKCEICDASFKTKKEFLEHLEGEESEIYNLIDNAEADLDYIEKEIKKMKSVSP